MPKHLISLYITKKEEGSNILVRLQRIAKEQDRSLNWVVLRAVKEFLAREEGHNANKDG